MTKDADKLKGTKAKSTGGGQLETGVNGRNYGEKGSVFIALNPDKTTVIVRRNSSVRDEAGNPYQVTEQGLKQWGAWLSYLKRIGYNTKFMESRDYFTVPAPWPHAFDAEASIARDDLAGNAYLEARRQQSNQEFDRSTELRRATVVNAMRTFKRQPADPKVPPPPPPQSSAELKTPARPASDALRAKMGLPPRPKEPPPMPGDDEFVEGFDIP